MWTNLAEELILASASPRRRDLLEQLAVPVRQIVLPVEGEDEPRLREESVTDYVMRTALEKNRRVTQHLKTTGQACLPTLSADTTVALGQTILGKPLDASDAKRILTTLAGKTHDVYTAVVLDTNGHTQQALVHSRVSMDASLLSALDSYIASGEPFGKAGAYALQGIAAAYIAQVVGSYSSVVGLPLFETAQLLRQAGLYQ